MTRRDYTPRAYAGKALSHLADVPRCALFAGMGMGKTSIVLTFLDHLHNVAGEDRPTLVLAPLRVARSTWPEEALKWTHLSGLEVVNATGTPAEREAALRRDVPVVSTNYDNLQWLVKHYEGRAWPFSTVVADESTRLKNLRISDQVSKNGKKFTRGQGGSRSKALAKVVKHTKRWINLTGTPAPNGLIDLWGQTWFLDRGQRLGRTFSGFDDRYFVTKRKPGQHFGGTRTPMPYTEQFIYNALSDICLTLDPKDWFDLKAPIVNIIQVDMPKPARAKYRELEKDLFTRLDAGQEVEVFNAAALSIKCLQFANGAVYTDPDHPEAWTEVHDEKLAALESIIEEAAGAPVLVAYHFKSDLARLQRAFPAGRTLDADPATIAQWNAGRVQILFAHPASAGHGLNLQDGGNIIVFFGHWWDLEQHDQIIERIGPVRQLQAGHDRAVFIHYIVARGTIDEVVMARRDDKREVQDLLLDYMKGKQ